MAVLGRKASRREWIGVLGLSAAGGALVLGGIFAYEAWTLHANRNAVTVGTGPTSPFRKFVMPGIARPPAIEADRAKLRPDEEVLGFVVNGKARAYRLEALSDRSRHVVNDVIGDLPLTVTYCDLDTCARAYTGQPGQGPLEVSVGACSRGARWSSMSADRSIFRGPGSPTRRPRALSNGSRGASRSSGSSRSGPTWGEWKRDHPETDVYEGPEFENQ